MPYALPGTPAAPTPSPRSLALPDLVLLFFYGAPASPRPRPFHFFFIQAPLRHSDSSVPAPVVSPFPVPLLSPVPFANTQSKAGNVPPHRPAPFLCSSPMAQPLPQNAAPNSMTSPAPEMPPQSLHLSLTPRQNARWPRPTLRSGAPFPPAGIPRRRSRDQFSVLRQIVPWPSPCYQQFLASLGLPWKDIRGQVDSARPALSGPFPEFPRIPLLPLPISFVTPKPPPATRALAPTQAQSLQVPAKRVTPAPTNSVFANKAFADRVGTPC